MASVENGLPQPKVRSIFFYNSQPKERLSLSASAVVSTHVANLMPRAQSKSSAKAAAAPPESSSSEDESEGESSSEEEEELDLDPFGRVAFAGGSIDYETQAIDSALSLGLADGGPGYAALVADCEAVFTARASADGETLSAGTTFWASAASAGGKKGGVCALERLALSIFSHHTRNAEYNESTSGAEWWTQVIEEDDDIGLHWDRDYDMQQTEGLLLHPHLATVTYVSCPPAAAPTVVLDCISPLLPDETPCGPIPSATACWPQPGRHLSFDGRKLHGAMSDLAASASTAAGSSKAKPPKRITLLVNVWLNHVPWGAEPLPWAIRKKLHNEIPGVSMMAGGTAGKGKSKAKATDTAVPVAATRVDAKAMAKASAQHEWTFGDEEEGSSSRLTLAMRWPTKVAATPTAPLVEVEFGSDGAELKRAAKAKAAGKKGASSAAGAKKRKR